MPKEEKKESITERWAKKKKFKAPEGAGTKRDEKIKEAEKKGMGKTSKKKKY